MNEKYITQENRKEITARSMVELHDKIKLNAKKGWHLAEKPNNVLKAVLT